MAGRTFAIGDLHGDLDALFRVLAAFPELDAEDTIVFLGDYVDRGPKSKGVVDYVRDLPTQTPAKIVALRGNHEDAWLRVIDRGWPEFSLPIVNGCRATVRSFQGHDEPPPSGTMPPAEAAAILDGSFFPPDVVAWMRQLPYYYEDAHAIYVHAGLPRVGEGFADPATHEPRTALLWCRDEHFFRSYTGKRVVFGHTATAVLPAELSSYTPEDPTDIWAGPCTVGLDTGAGKGGFLTALELPALRVYESR